LSFAVIREFQRLQVNHLVQDKYLLFLGSTDALRLPLPMHVLSVVCLTKYEQKAELPALDMSYA
jgi:hypothetical protein